MMVFPKPKSTLAVRLREEQGTVYWPEPTSVAPGKRATIGWTMEAGSWERVPPESRKTGCVPLKMGVDPLLEVMLAGVVTPTEFILIQ